MLLYGGDRLLFSGMLQLSGDRLVVIGYYIGARGYYVVA